MSISRKFTFRQFHRVAQRVLKTKEGSAIIKFECNDGRTMIYDPASADCKLQLAEKFDCAGYYGRKIICIHAVKETIEHSVIVFRKEDIKEFIEQHPSDNFVVKTHEEGSYHFLYYGIRFGKVVPHDYLPFDCKDGTIDYLLWMWKKHVPADLAVERNELMKNNIRLNLSLDRPVCPAWVPDAVILKWLATQKDKDACVYQLTEKDVLQCCKLPIYQNRYFSQYLYRSQTEDGSDTTKEMLECLLLEEYPEFAFADIKTLPIIADTQEYSVLPKDSSKKVPEGKTFRTIPTVSTSQ